MSISESKLFDINEFIQNNSVREIKNVENKNEGNEFYDAVAAVKEHFESLYSESSISDREKVKRQDIEHNAILGDAEAESILVGEIETFLRKNNMLGYSFPSFFMSLSHGIFHEIYRFGVFYKWNAFRESPSAIIQGDEIWFKIDGVFVKQEEKLRDEFHVEEIIRALKVPNKGLIINESHPQAEVEMKDGTRVTIVIPPRSYKPSIIFRRFIINQFSFFKQSEKETIHNEDISFFKDMAKLYLNTIVAGHVESGKSTFLKTIYGERDPDKIAVLVETSPESYLKRDFPERLVHDFYTTNGNVEDVIRVAMRTDHDYVIFQEVRGYEAEGAIKGTERGTRGLLMTYHITDPARTPEQLAEHIVDAYPNRDLSSTIRRIARQLDLGITMKNFEGNKKKVTSVYEIAYSYEENRAWINYLIKYDPKENTWVYNADISEGLKNRMSEHDEGRAAAFIQHLKKQSQKRPMKNDRIQEIVLRG